MAVGQIRLDRADAGEIDTGPALPIQSVAATVFIMTIDPKEDC